MMLRTYFLLLFLSLNIENLYAGIIAPDGTEWELRSGSGTHYQHLISSQYDTGWTWATVGDWNSAFQSDQITLDEPGRSAFSGSCDINLSIYLCGGVFSDSPANGNIFVLRPVATNSEIATSWTLGEKGFTTLNYMISYRETAIVPVPATFWLFTSGLLGLVGYRKFNKDG